jgi:hypothetical protein
MNTEPKASSASIIFSEDIAGNRCRKRCADEVVHTEAPRGPCAHHGHHQQERELRPRCVGRDILGEAAKRQRNHDHDPGERRQRESEALDGLGLQHKKEDRQRQQLRPDGF